MELIENFIQKATKVGGFHSLSTKEADELNSLKLVAENLENNIIKLMPLPTTINGVIQQKIAELKINHLKFAELLGVGTFRLSQILNGKLEPDFTFLKALHEKLGISGDFMSDDFP